MTIAFAVHLQKELNNTLLLSCLDILPALSSSSSIGRRLTDWVLTCFMSFYMKELRSRIEIVKFNTLIQAAFSSVYLSIKCCEIYAETIKCYGKVAFNSEIGKSRRSKIKLKKEKFYSLQGCELLIETWIQATLYAWTNEFLIFLIIFYCMSSYKIFFLCFLTISCGDGMCLISKRCKEAWDV